jgi:hypothetical protein
LIVLTINIKIMNIKINIVNDKFTKISPMAFGSLFSNLSEYVVDETPEKTFKNIGVFVGKKIVDYEGIEYKIISISEMNKFENRTNETIYKIELRKL